MADPLGNGTTAPQDEAIGKNESPSWMNGYTNMTDPFGIMNTAGGNLTDDDCPPLEIIYFLKYDTTNQSVVENMTKAWPCEVRKYFNEMQIFVNFVQFLFDYGSFALIAVGLVVNTYSLFVLRSPPINKSNVSIYLKALAFSDMGALIFNVAVSVSRARFDVINNFYTSHREMCILHRILSTIFFYFSTWLVVLLTYERLLMVKYPFKVQTCNNRKLAKVAVAILVISSLVISSLRSTMNGFEKDNMYGYRSCGTNDHKINIKLVPFVCVNLLLPICLVIVANIGLLANMRCSTHLQFKSNFKFKGSFKGSDDKANKLKVTRMVIIISVAYITLYLPLGIIAIYDIVNKQRAPDTSEENYIMWRKKWLLLKYMRSLCFFLHLLIYVNNFFLYCLSGDIFRQTVKVCLPTFLHKICPRLVSKPVILRRGTHCTQTYYHSPTNNSSVSRTSIKDENCYVNTTYIKDSEEISSHKNWYSKKQ